MLELKEKVEESKKAPPRQARRQRGKARSTKTDIRIQQKDCAQQQVRGNLIQQNDELAKFKSVGRSRVQCKREASRIRRATAADRSANDIAKQVTMTRERHKSHQNM